MIIMSLAVAGASLAQGRANDTKTEDLKDGYVRVTTASYTLEVPKGWDVSGETSFGQREMSGAKTKMTAMTAGGGGGPTNWDQLYQTAVWFSTREGGKATPYKLSKSAQGYEAMSYTVVNENGFATNRYVILKAPKGAILALSVKIPDEKRESELMKHFDRLVKTASIK